jgi:hypothetical protein
LFDALNAVKAVRDDANLVDFAITHHRKSSPYALARFQFKMKEEIAFTILSFRFARCLAFHAVLYWESYMTTFTNAGVKDFEIKDGKLVSALDQPLAIEITEKWAKLVKDGGPPAWSNYIWYQCGADFGAGKDSRRTFLLTTKSPCDPRAP